MFLTLDPGLVRSPVALVCSCVMVFKMTEDMVTYTVIAPAKQSKTTGPNIKTKYDLARVEAGTLILH